MNSTRCWNPVLSYNLVLLCSGAVLSLWLVFPNHCLRFSLKYLLEYKMSQNIGDDQPVQFFVSDVSFIPRGHRQVSTASILPQVWLHPWFLSHSSSAVSKCKRHYIISKQTTSVTTPMSANIRKLLKNHAKLKIFVIHLRERILDLKCWYCFLASIIILLFPDII